MAVVTATMNRKADGFWKTGLWCDPNREHPIHAAWWSGFLLAVFAYSGAYAAGDHNWLSTGIFAAGAVFHLARSIRLNRTWHTEPEEEE